MSAGERTCPKLFNCALEVIFKWHKLSWDVALDWLYSTFLIVEDFRQFFDINVRIVAAVVGKSSIRIVVLDRLLSQSSHFYAAPSYPRHQCIEPNEKCQLEENVKRNHLIIAILIGSEYFISYERESPSKMACRSRI